MNTSDDLTSLFTAQPGGPAQPVTYRQGVIQTWNPITLQNTVLVGGTVMQDLPVLGVAEAASFKPGAVVGVQVVGSSWAIIGRFVVPNTPEAFDAITQLSSRTKTAIIDAQETTTSTSYTDLATPGPAVTLDVGASGRVLMILSAKGGWSVNTSNAASGARMSAELSGANTLAASTTWAAWIYNQYITTTTSVTDASITSAYVFEGLTPGATTFTAKYRSDNAAITVDFNRRTIVVIAL